MNTADVVILGLIALSTAFSVWRGFVKEGLSLAAFIGAFWIAIEFTEVLSPRYERWFASPQAAVAVAFASLFIGTLLLGVAANFLIGKVLKKTGLTGADRALGAAFGFARGVVIVAAFVLLAGLTSLPDRDWWDDSLTLGWFQPLAETIRSNLPGDVARHFDYN